MNYRKETLNMLSNGIAIPINRKQARLYVYIYIYRSICPCARMYIDKYALQGRSVYLRSADAYLYMRARVSVGAHTLRTHTHACAHARAHPHARTLTDTARTRCAAPVACVCKRARVCVSACQRAQMRECGLFQGVDTIHSV